MAASTPLITVLNLGGELLYVLDQRLRAQRIAKETAIKVLADIVGVLFDEELLKELEVSPGLGKHTYVKQLIEDVASVSIMRLDRLSMDKLWELTVMVFKWQLTLIEPDRLFYLTRRHLCGIAKLLPGHPVVSKVQRCHSRLEDVAETMPRERIVYMRNSILAWLNDFHIKVSLLLRLGFQRTDGSFVMGVDPDDATSKILQNLGDNIYLYEMNESVDSDGAREKNADVSEVSLLARDILGDSPKKLPTGRVKHYFLQRENEKLDAVSSSNPIAACEFEESSPQRRKNAIDTMGMVVEEYPQGTSLRDDLLNMLENSET